MLDDSGIHFGHLAGASMSRVFAYCRVSTSTQTTENQVLELKQAGFAIEPRRVIRETVSGSQAAHARPEFAKLLDRLEPGDVLVVTKLDRLGRSALDVRTVVDELAVLGREAHEAARKKGDPLPPVGVRVHCLALGGVDLTSPTGRMTMQVINAVAEFELDLLKERTHSGLNRAREQGKKFGRPPALSDAQAQEVRDRLARDEPVAALAREFKVGRATVQRLRPVGAAA
jgi:putative DNA-invertase from lambdoid prophage Rac